MANVESCCKRSPTGPSGETPSKVDVGFLSLGRSTHFWLFFLPLCI